MRGALLCNSESVNTVLVLTLIEGHKIYNALLAIVVIDNYNYCFSLHFKSVIMNYFLSTSYILL